MRTLCIALLVISSLVTAQPAEAQALKCAEFQTVALAAGWKQSEWPRVRRIIWRESRCDPSQYNGRRRDRSYGLMQINTKGALWEELQWRCQLTSKDQLFDPFTNLSCARSLHRAYGWRPWRV